MEQVRVALAWMVKYHFWLLSALAVLVATGSWYLAASDLREQYNTFKGKIDQVFSSQQSLQNRSYHPNPDVNAKQREEIVRLAEETKAIWQELYDRQRQEVLKWPDQLPPGFRREVEGKQFGDEISQPRREQYTTYIRGRFDDLPKIIDANELDESRSGGRSRGGGGEFGGRGGFDGGRGGFAGRSPNLMVDENGDPIEIDYLVYWDDADQQRIKDDLDWQTTQSYWRIWVTQENLWVYETMLRAVAGTNEAKNADRRSNAAVTDIFALEVGKLAAKESRGTGRIKRLEGAQSMATGEFGEMDAARGGEMMDGAAAEGTTRGGLGDGLGEFGMDGGRGGVGTGELSPAEEKAFRLSGRYIDGDGQPIMIPPDDQPLDPGAFGNEVKRLPVRMVLRMDTRWLTMLVSQLANADLQIQVTEVRVNPQNYESGGGGRGGFGGRGGGRSEFGGRGGFGGFGGGGTDEILVFDRRPYLKPVIIQGIVLIFNPPNEALLEVEGAEGADVSPAEVASL